MEIKTSTIIQESVYLHYYNSLIDGDKAACAQIVTGLIDEGIEIKDLYLNLFQRSMYQIGEMWEHNKSSVAEEHIATKITESLLNLAYPKVSKIKKNGKSVLITCVDKEFHEIGPRMVADFFELYGWTAYFLGANTPKADLLDIIDKKKPDIVGISNNFYINVLRLLRILEDLKAQFPDQKVIIGGQALADGKDEVIKKYDNVKYIGSLDDLEVFLKGE